MRALPNRRIVDAKFSRLTLVSQWPLLLHEWAFRELTTPGLRAGLVTWMRALVLCALCFAIQIAFLYVAYWGVAWFAPPEVAAWVTLGLFAVCIASFQWSVDTGKPVGLFWIAAQLERPLRPKPRPDGSAV
jgi:hypothetical protein